MSIIIEDSKEVTCSRCADLRRAFIIIAVSAVLPMIVFSAVILLLSAEKIDSHLEAVTAIIVQFVLGLLYLQLFVASAFLIIGFLKRHRPVLKYQFWYIMFHVLCMSLFIISSLIMTLANESYALSVAVIIAGGSYAYIIYYYMKLRVLRLIF